MVIIQKKSGGTWWKCLLSFFGGIVFTITAVFGGAAIAATQVSTGTLLGKYADTVLTVEYQQKSLYDIVMEVVGKKLDYHTLEDLSKVTPLIDKYLDKAIKKLEDNLGCELDKDVIKSKQYKDIPSYLVDQVKNTSQIAKILRVKNDSSAILLNLCYPKKDDGTFDKQHPFVLKDFFDDSNFIKNRIDNMTIGEAIGENSSNKVLTAIKDYTIKELRDDDVIGNLLVSDVVDIDDSSPKILRAFRDRGTKVKEMSDVIDDLYLDDVFEYDDYDSLPPALKKMIGNTDGYVLVTGGVAHINHEDYDDVVFSNSNNPDEETFLATDYSDIGGFFDKQEIAVQLSGEKYVVVGSGDEDRGDNYEFDIPVTSPWSTLYMRLCNKPTKVNELNACVDDLKLKDVMNIEPTSPLYKVRHTPVKDSDDLFENIKHTLTIRDIFGDELENYKFINKIDENTTINNIGDAINNMKLMDAFDDNIYDSDGNLIGMWKYLLIEGTEAWINGTPNKSTDPFTGYECMEYTLSGDGKPGNPKGIDQMMDNMKYWMENQKLQILQDDGMIYIEGDLLISEIPGPVRAFYPALDAELPPGALYGDLSMKQFIELMTRFPGVTE